MNDIDKIMALITLATDTGATTEEARTAAMQACLIFRKSGFVITEPTQHIFSEDVAALKAAGNSYIVDDKHDRILIRSIRKTKENLIYTYYPLKRRWSCSNKPAQDYTCTSAEQLLSAYINKRSPWDKDQS